MHIRTNKTLSIIFRPVLWASEWLGVHHPIMLMKLRYYARFHKRLDLNNPKTLNEKILYLSLRTDTSLWTVCSDKYEVREYVKKCGLEDILVKLYGVWENAQDIDFDNLPEKYVLKGTHSCDDLIFVDGSNPINRDEAITFFEKDLKTKYGAFEGGMHYLRIKPRIIAEELLDNDAESLRFSSTLIDYKVWCFNGKPNFIWTVSNRDGNHKESMVYDLNWTPRPECQVYENGYIEGRPLPRPLTLEAMIDAAEKLAKPFPEVRVDFYSLGNKLYFGELTFTSHGGLMQNYTDEFQKEIGDLIDLSKVKTIR